MTIERLNEYSILVCTVLNFIIGIVFIFYLEKGVDKKEYSQREADFYRDAYSANAVVLTLIVIMGELAKS